MKTNFKHKRSVRSETDSRYYTEYDKYDRVTFYSQHHNGYWCLKFYDDPVSGRLASRHPFQVVHSNWEYYNDLKS